MDPFEVYVALIVPVIGLRLSRNDPISRKIIDYLLEIGAMSVWGVVLWAALHQPKGSLKFWVGVIGPVVVLIAGVVRFILLAKGTCHDIIIESAFIVGGGIVYSYVFGSFRKGWQRVQNGIKNNWTKCLSIYYHPTSPPPSSPPEASHEQPNLYELVQQMLIEMRRLPSPLDDQPNLYELVQQTLTEMKTLRANVSELQLANRLHQENMKLLMDKLTSRASYRQCPQCSQAPHSVAEVGSSSYQHYEQPMRLSEMFMEIPPLWRPTSISQYTMGCLRNEMLCGASVSTMIIDGRFILCTTRPSAATQPRVHLLEEEEKEEPITYQLSL